jgi:DnaJ family protein C protein 13
VLTVLKRKEESIHHAAVEMLCSLMQPMHPNYELRFEQLNKSALLSSRQFVDYLLQLTTDHIQNNTGSLVIASMLDFLTYTICVPYRHFFIIHISYKSSNLHTQPIFYLVRQQRGKFLM